MAAKIHELQGYAGLQLTSVLTGPLMLDAAIRLNYHGVDGSAMQGAPRGIDPADLHPPERRGMDETEETDERDGPEVALELEEALPAAPPRARRHTDSRPPAPVRAAPAPPQPAAAPASGAGEEVVLQALVQLLVEKGLLDREELAQRINALGRGPAPRAPRR